MSYFLSRKSETFLINKPCIYPWAIYEFCFTIYTYILCFKIKTTARNFSYMVGMYNTQARQDTSVSANELGHYRACVLRK